MDELLLGLLINQYILLKMIKLYGKLQMLMGVTKQYINRAVAVAVAVSIIVCIDSHILLFFCLFYFQMQFVNLLLIHLDLPQLVMMAY